MKLPSAKVLGVLLALGAAVLVLALWPRKPESPKERIERLVVELTYAAQERDLGAIMEHVSERFTSSEGLDKQAIKGVLAGQLLRGSWVRVFTTELSIDVLAADSAQLTGTFIFARSEATRLEDLAKDSVMSRYVIDAKLALESGDQWRFVSARYRQQ